MPFWCFGWVGESVEDVCLGEIIDLSMESIAGLSDEYDIVYCSGSVR